MSDQPIVSDALEYREYGQPMNMLKLTQHNVDRPKTGEVLVKMLAASVNPSDIFTLMGKYPSRPPLPAIGGNEGVGEVVEVGAGVSSLSVGDLVCPFDSQGGAWQTYSCKKAEAWLRFDKRIPVSTAAVLIVNPSTAYLMLKESIDLKPGDVIIQNGSNSAVGIYVIQIAKIMEVKTINLFRARTTDQATEETRQYLKDSGATWALTEDEFAAKDHPVKAELAKHPAPILGLNCVGGQSGITLLESLGPGGRLISYGNMVGQPMSVPAANLIFENQSIHGFWLMHWLNLVGRDAIEKLIAQLTEWFLSGKLKVSKFVEIPLESWKDAIGMSSSFTNKKPTVVKEKAVLVMNRD